MKEKTLHTLTSSLLFLVVIVHLLRIIFNWQLTINSWNIPFWASYIAIIIAGFLAYYLYKTK